MQCVSEWVCVVCAVLVAAAEAGSPEARQNRRKQRKELKVKDCGGDPYRPIQVQYLRVRPLPITIPGKVRVWTGINITEDLPLHMGVNVHVVKQMKGFEIPLSMTPGHHKDICSIIASHFELRGCPKSLRRNEYPCACPYKKGVYQIDNLRFPLPDVDPPMYRFVEGQFKLRLQITDETNKRELGCIQLGFYVKRQKRNRRWFQPSKQ